MRHLSIYYSYPGAGILLVCSRWCSAVLMCAGIKRGNSLKTSCIPRMPSSASVRGHSAGLYVAGVLQSFGSRASSSATRSGCATEHTAVLRHRVHSDG